MTDRTCINVKKEAHREAKEAKQDDETWGDYLLRCTNQEPRPSGDLHLEQINKKLDQIQGAQGDTVSEAIGLADGSLAGLEREVKKAQEIAESARDNTEQIKEGMRG